MYVFIEHFLGIVSNLHYELQYNLQATITLQ